MELLQLREKEIFETLKKISNFKFVVIGGYAVNCYTLPRFSVDCDIVIENTKEAKEIGNYLKKLGFIKADAESIDAYDKKFIRFEKSLLNNFKVSMDFFVEGILDRQTNAAFKFDWVLENSALRYLKGKTITEQIKLRVINIDALFAMKFISCRSVDIRDMFMLATNIKSTSWIKNEISKRYDFNERLNKIKNKINSVKFKDNLQGVYGYVDEELFEKHKNALLRMA